MQYNITLGTKSKLLINKIREEINASNIILQNNMHAFLIYKKSSANKSSRDKREKFIKKTISISNTVKQNITSCTVT